jgi:hypothetical protein
MHIAKNTLKAEGISEPVFHFVALAVANAIFEGEPIGEWVNDAAESEGQSVMGWTGHNDGGHVKHVVDSIE